MTKEELSVKDLMINDWVNAVIDGEVYPSVITKMERDTEDFKVEFLAVPRDWEEGDFFDEIQPIPLTDAILKANGFNREGGVSYWHEGGRDASIIYWSKEKTELIIGCSHDDYFVKMPVRYVHELQHAFRLAGIDKEIKLEE